MIAGIGIDSIEIERFKGWSSHTKNQLARLFSPDEIEYCLQSKTKSAERFAARFAAKEAFFKAWNSAFPDSYAPFLTFCKAISVARNGHGAPQIAINKALLPKPSSPFTPLISITHTRTLATVLIFLQIDSI